MEEYISYLLIAVFFFGLYLAWRNRNARRKQFILSDQAYPGLRLMVMVHKLGRQTKAISLKVNTKSPVLISRAEVELINKTREFHYYDLRETALITDDVKALSGQPVWEVTMDFEQFKKQLQDGPHPFRTFRFILTDKSGTRYKSHELGLNKKWQLLKIDSGHYN